jgi:hypothetical protein
MGYAAIYPEDVISHHRAFIARRRTERPGEEYRDLTAAEWDEFLAHFELRKVALGTCGRDFGTPCAHENACVRCPLLRVDPAQRPRLVTFPALHAAERQGGTHSVADERTWTRKLTGGCCSLTLQGLNGVPLTAGHQRAARRSHQVAVTGAGKARVECASEAWVRVAV